MKRIQIEFNRAEQGKRRALLLGGAIALFVLLGAGAWGVGSTLAARAAHDLQRAEGMEAVRSSMRASMQHEEVIPAALAEAVNGAVRMLNYPTIELLSQLERHLRPDVAILGVELGAVRAAIRVTIEAASPGEALDFVEAIRSEPGFAQVALVRQESVSNVGGQGGAWRFTLEVPQAEAVARATAPQARGGEQ